MSSDVLILGTTVHDGMNSPEAQQAQTLGLSVEVVDAAGWSAKSAADFAAYKGLILGDPSTNTCDPSVYDPAVANHAKWGPAVSGNVIVLGTDPAYHVLNGLNSAGARKIITQGIAYATAVPGQTGAYIALGCAYDGAVADTAVPVLDAFGAGGFTVEGAVDDSTHITGMPTPALATLSDSDLRDWGASTHEIFDAYPGDFSVYALDSGFGTNGTPYILTRPAQGNVGPGPVGASTPELSSGELLASGLVATVAYLLYRRATREASGKMGTTPIPSTYHPKPHVRERA